jgi:hypothetical protein
MPHEGRLMRRALPRIGATPTVLPLEDRRPAFIAKGLRAADPLALYDAVFSEAGGEILCLQAVARGVLFRHGIADRLAGEQFVQRHACPLTP